MDPAIVPDERPIQNPATPPEICFNDPRFAGLVALAECPDPIPSRTRPSNAPAPMVLCLKTWESRSSPGLQNAEIIPLHRCWRSRHLWSVALKKARFLAGLFFAFENLRPRDR